MKRIIELYEFEDLSPKAQERAIQRYSIGQEITREEVIKRFKEYGYEFFENGNSVDIIEED